MSMRIAVAIALMCTIAKGEGGPVAKGYLDPSLPLMRGLYTFAYLQNNIAGARDSRSIAVLDLEGEGISIPEVNSLTERLRSELVRTGAVTVVERNRMEQILAEQDFQLTGCTSDECAVEVGQMLGVSTMVAGTVGKVGSTYALDVRAIDVETGKIMLSITRDYSGEIDGLLQEIGGSARDLIRELSSMSAVSTVEKAGDIDVNSLNYRYPGKAMMMSLALPGAGQLYVGRPMRTVFFLGAEIIALLAWNNYARQGEDMTLSFRDFANAHWHFHSWLDSAQYYQSDPWGRREGQIYVGTDGSHHLDFFVQMKGDDRPILFGNTKDDSERLYQFLNSDTSAYVFVKKNNEYYENIGKYNQFFSGWDDASPEAKIEERKSGLIALSEHRSLYLGMRADANHLKSAASYAISALMFNHVISAIDAIFATSRWNREHASRLSGRLWFNPAYSRGVSGVQLSLTW